jgi:hypothetical protein
MTFFHQAIKDGTIDERMQMNEQEFEMMLRGMLEDSNAWHLHKNKHRDARVTPIFQEDISEFEQKVKKHSKKEEEPNIIQYDMHSKKFMAGCQCGEKFSIDIKNDTVEHVDPNLKMKEVTNYDIKSLENQQHAQYGDMQISENNPYNMGPKIQQNSAYSNSGGNKKYSN